MRKQHLFRGLLLFSSVLGVALTSQVTLPSASNHHQLQLSVLTGSRVLADTTAESSNTAADMDDATFESNFTKYSQIQKDDGAGALSSTDVSLFNADFNNTAAKLIANANAVVTTKVGGIAVVTTPMSASDFKTITADYVQFIQNNTLDYNNATGKSMYQMLNPTAAAETLYQVPTPNDIAALYYHNLSVIAIKDAQITDFGGNQTDAKTKVDAFKTKYPSLKSFGEAVYNTNKNFTGLNALANATSNFSKMTQPDDIDSIAIDTSTQTGTAMSSSMMNRALGTIKNIASKRINNTLPSEPWATTVNLKAANAKITALTDYYTKVLNDPNLTMNVGMAVNSMSSQAAYMAINASTMDDASSIPATNTEKYAILKYLNEWAYKTVVATAQKVNIDATSSSLTTDQQAIVNQIQAALQQNLSSLATQVKSATTTSELDQLATSGINSLSKTGNTDALTPITDAEKTADKKAIDDAVTAQGKVLDADIQATEAQRTSYKNQISNTADGFKKGIDSAQYKEEADAIVDTAINNISTVTIPHTSGSGSTSTGTDSGSTTGKDSSSTDSSKNSSNADAVTAAQKTNAINALISAGNTQKLAIQDDTSLTDAEKTAAYAAIDKLVSSYQTSLNAATNQEAFLAAQIGGLTAVNNYKAGSSSSDKTAVTTPSDTATTTATTTTSTTPAKSSKGTKVVYATARLKMYSDAGLTKHTVTYAKHARTSRPEFTVFQTKTNDNGTKVYYVRNTASGRKGYISASSKYTSYAYYQTGAKKIKVISKSGVNAYKKSNLSSKKYHYKKGATLKIKKIVKSGLTTRFQLTNGTYVSANKIFVYTIA